MGFGLKVSGSVGSRAEWDAGRGCKDLSGWGEVLGLEVICRSPSFPGTSDQRDAGREGCKQVTLWGFVKHRYAELGTAASGLARPAWGLEEQ